MFYISNEEQLVTSILPYDAAQNGPRLFFKYKIFRQARHNIFLIFHLITSIRKTPGWFINFQSVFYLLYYILKGVIKMQNFTPQWWLLVYSLDRRQHVIYTGRNFIVLLKNL